MAFIYRSLQDNFVVNTPVIGLPSDILLVNISGASPKYNGAYLFLPKDSSKYIEIKNEVYPGFTTEWVSIWLNTNSQDMFIAKKNSPYPYLFYYDLIDISYRSLRSDSNYTLLYQPYFAVQDTTYDEEAAEYYGEAYNPYEIPWDKNILLYPATSGPLSGLNAVPGGNPTSKNYSLNIPNRILVSGTVVIG